MRYRKVRKFRLLKILTIYWLIARTNLKFLDHSATLTSGESFSLLQLDSNLTDLNLELFAKSFSTLVILLFLTQFISQTKNFSIQAISTVFSSL